MRNRPPKHHIEKSEQFILIQVRFSSVQYPVISGGLCNSAGWYWRSGKQKYAQVGIEFSDSKEERIENYLSRPTLRQESAYLTILTFPRSGLSGTRGVEAMSSKRVNLVQCNGVRVGDWQNLILSAVPEHVVSKPSRIP
jgi:hypothetical protein